MKGLCLIQPWASLVVLGAKRWETRGWRTNHRGPLAIHAGRRFPDAARALCEAEPFRSVLLRAGFRHPSDLPCGALLGTVTLVDCLPTQRILAQLPRAAPELVFGDYRPGRWAWQLADPLCLPSPVAFPGRVGLFEVPDSLCSRSAASTPLT